VGGGGEQENAGEGEEGSKVGVPARCVPAGRSAGMMRIRGTMTTTSPVIKADFDGVVRRRPAVWN